jgi:hypothetical protein
MYDGLNENTLSPDFQISNRLVLTENYKQLGYAEEKLNPAKGILYGMTISVMLWIPTIAFVYWLL